MTQNVFDNDIKEESLRVKCWNVYRGFDCVSLGPWFYAVICLLLVKY